MKILYFYQYFSTPKGSWGTRVYEYASEWVKQGHEVTVVTSVYSKSDLNAKKFLETQSFNGIKVKIINVEINNKSGFLKRIASFLSYAIMACWYAIKESADVVISSSGPITVGIPGLLAKWFRGRSLVFEARDLWPEGAIELGVLKNPLLQKVAYWFEGLCYRNSKLVVGLSPGIRDYVINNHEHPNAISVTNSANLELFGIPKELPEDFTLEAGSYAIYTGNIGVVNNSEWLYQCAKELKERGREDIVVLLIGEGQQREELVARAEREEVNNFIRMGLMPKENLIAYVQSAIVSLVPLKGTPILDTSSPNKFFESLAAGVPIVQNTKGWMKDYLQENNVGYTLDPNSPRELADLLIRLKDNPEELKDQKKNAVLCAQRDFDKTKLAQQMLEALVNVK